MSEDAPKPTSTEKNKGGRPRIADRAKVRSREDAHIYQMLFTQEEWETLKVRAEGHKSVANYIRTKLRL